MTSGYHQQTAARAFARRIERTSAGLLLVSKTGLLPYLDFDLDRCTADLEKISPAATVLPVSARAETGSTVAAGLIFSRSAVHRSRSKSR